MCEALVCVNHTCVVADLHKVTASQKATYTLSCFSDATGYLVPGTCEVASLFCCIHVTVVSRLL